MSQEKAAEIIELNPPLRAEGGAGPDDAGDQATGDARVDTEAPGASVEASAEPAEKAGVTLAAARAAGGYTHSAISDATKIKVNHLVAIEASDRDALPALPFTFGFVKTYAKFLGLDADELAHQFRHDIGADEPPAETVEEHIAPTPSVAIDGVRLVSLIGIGAIVVFAIWITVQIMGPREGKGGGEAVTARVTLGAAPAVAVETAPLTEPVVPPQANEAKPAEAPSTTQAAGEAPETPAPAAIDADAPPAPVPAAVPDAVFVTEGATDADNAIDAAVAGITDDAPSQTPLIETAADQEPTSAGPTIDEILIASADFFDAEGAIADAGAAQTTIAAPDIIAVDESTSQQLAEAQNSTLAQNTITPNPAQSPPAQRTPAPAQEFAVEARATRTVAPTYPQRCERRAAPLESVIVIFDVTARGRVANARVVDSSNGCFNMAAIASVGKWRFDPRTVNGQPRPETGKRATVRFQQ